MRQMLVEHRVYRADLFLRAQHAYARAAGLLPFCIWLPYMANELQVFLQSLPRQTNRRPQPEDEDDSRVSVEGVRALGLIVAILNAATVGGLGYAVVGFPAPQVYSPFVLFGAGWSLVAMAAVSWATASLIWSLSEPRDEAMKKAAVAVDARATMTLRLMRDDDSGNASWKEKFGDLFGFVTSWQGRTLLSTINHLVSIVLFVYGLVRFSAVLHDSLQIGLGVGVALSVLGLLVSGVSLALRKWP